MRRDKNQLSGINEAQRALSVLQELRADPAFSEKRVVLTQLLEWAELAIELGAIGKLPPAFAGRLG